MVVVAVAGGSGDLGRLVVDALLKRGGHEVYVLSRKVPEEVNLRLSPITGRQYGSIIQTDYSSEEDLAKLFTEHNVHTVICTLGVDFESASDVQIRLIRAADKASSVKRFIPSEFNIDYDLGDDILPYPEKRFHQAARRELEKTSLEFTYIYVGMFMDYYGVPYIETHLRPLPGWFDEVNNTVTVSGDGNAYCVMSYTKDVARYTALALELDQWPKVLKIMASRLTENQLVGLIEKNLGRKLTVEYVSVEEMRNSRTSLLESGDPFAENFPGGAEQLSALMVDIGTSMALGAYDFESSEGLDLIAAFDGKTEPPLRIEQLIEKAWNGR
ncbi:NmrA-like family protein [Whalleya microplaca]|nr:NmrA-like family protein [Whalleya microplaca]